MTSPAARAVRAGRAVLDGSFGGTPHRVDAGAMPDGAAGSVVWVSPELNARPRSGGTIRTARLVRHLARQVPVHLVVIGRNAEDPAELRAALGVASATVFRYRRPFGATHITAWSRGWPPWPAKLWHPEIASVVRGMQEEGATTVLDLAQTWIYRPRRGRFVLSSQNVEGERLHEQPRKPRPPGVGSAAQEALRRAGVRRLRRWEQRLARSPRATVVAVSEEDARALSPDAVVIPNGADVVEDPPEAPLDGDTLFVGSFDYPPNVAAVAWWIEEVWPYLREPRVPLTVVGRGAEHALADLRGHPGVDVVGEVDDVAPHLERASVVAVPLRHGGGTRLKILEAFAWNRPVVSTAKGAEGLAVEDGEHLLLADDGAAFAAALERLRSDQALRAHLSGRGRDVVAAMSWDRLGERLVEVVRSVIAQNSDRRGVG